MIRALKVLKGRVRRSVMTGTRSLIRRIGNPSGNSRPVFLVGAGRSGTSMIVRRLARSWRVEFYNENNPAAFDYYRLRSTDVVHSLIDDSLAPIVLFKPIKDTPRTRSLLSKFPDARVIFTFRHFDDVVNSDRRKFYNEAGEINHPKHNLPKDRRTPVVRWMDSDFDEFADEPPPESTREWMRSRWSPDLNLESNIALHWLFMNRMYFDLGLDRDERVELAQYEEIVSAPDHAFQAICEFIGLPYHTRISDGVFSTSVQRHPPPTLDPGIRSDCEALWQRMCEAAAR